MTGSDTADRQVIVWITEGTWRASIDAASHLAPPGTRIALLHITPGEVPQAAHGAYLGLFGRESPGRGPGPQIAGQAAGSAGELLAAAARWLGRPCDRIERHGESGSEVVSAAAGIPPPPKPHGLGPHHRP